jgi:hypothetical protein
MNDATPSLRFPPSSPATQQARHLFSSLECWLASAPALQLPLHRVEQQQEQRGRQVQRLLLQAHVQQRGAGDAGPALHVFQEGSGCLYTHRRLQRRTLKTIFGPIDIDRFGYSRPGAASIHPLDEVMQLPARSFSYELQKRLVKAAVQGTFRESTERILDSTGLSVPKTSMLSISSGFPQPIRRPLRSRWSPWTARASRWSSRRTPPAGSGGRKGKKPIARRWPP